MTEEFNARTLFLIHCPWQELKFEIVILTGGLFGLLTKKLENQWRISVKNIEN